MLLPSLHGGGAERSMLSLIKGFLAHGRTVDLVLCQAKGAYLGEIPVGATMIELEATGNCRRDAAPRWAIVQRLLRIAASGVAGDQDRPGNTASTLLAALSSKHIDLT